MTLALTLSAKLLPLYVLILIGFIAGRRLGVEKRSIATLTIYTITPVVIFYGIMRTEITPSLILLPLLMFVLSIIVSLVFQGLGRLQERAEMAGMLGFAAASGNVGYFGIPVSVMIFGEDALGPAAAIVLGASFYENTYGVYSVAADRYSPKKALQTVLTLPTLYGFFLGLACNLLHTQFPTVVIDMLHRFVGAYTVLGMMIVGLGLAKMTRASFDLGFTLHLSAAHFLVWPLLSGAVIVLDASSYQILSRLSQQVLLFMSIVPVAANTVAWASVFDLKPDKVALSVLITTLTALVYIPVFAAIFLL